MRKYLIPFGILAALSASAISLPAAGGTLYRSAPPRYVMSAPAYQAPRIINRAPAGPHYTPGIRPGFHPAIVPQFTARPMINGRFGWHPARNRSSFVVMPELAPDDAPVDTENFIASIDFTTPLEPIVGCSAAPCQWGAMSMSNDGSWGNAWSFYDADAARAAAIGNCASQASEPCAGIFTAVGTAWIAGLHCQHYDAAGAYWHWSVMALGDDLGAALRNAYRTVVMSGFYNPDECDFVAAVAANGAQTQFIAQE